MSVDSTPPVERQCTLWVHDETFSKRPVVFNPAVLAGHNVKLGSLLRVVKIATGVAVQDFQAEDDRPQSVHSTKHAQIVSAGDAEPAPSQHTGANEDPRRHFVFKLDGLEHDDLSRHPSVQISVCAPVARLYGFSNRMKVVVIVAEERLHVASHIELTIRDMYLTRADMRRLVISELWQKTLYRGQELIFLGSVRTTVKSIYLNGGKVNSALFTQNTRPIFRSESARFVIYIQMSKEMWEFETTCSGDIMAEKVINRFLPDLFRRWASLKAHHAISIVLFTRIEVDEDHKHNTSLPETGRTSVGSTAYRDYYRVVCSAMSSSEAPTILYDLKKEFREFLKDALTVETSYVDEHSNTTRTRSSLSGRPSSAQNGNFLEAINLVTTQYAEDNIDRDLVRTGLSVMIISPGTGIFEVDEHVLQLTTDNLAHNGIGIDLVCLSPKPLHVTPLFRYKNRAASRTGRPPHDNRRPWSPSIHTSHIDNPIDRFRMSIPGLSPPSKYADNDLIDGQQPDLWTFAQPHWLEIHYFKDRTDPRLKSTAFLPQIRMYEVQMSGRQELDMSLISIPFLNETHKHLPQHTKLVGQTSAPTPFVWLDQYDEERFQQRTSAIEPKKNETVRKAGYGRNSLARPPHVADIFRPPEAARSMSIDSQASAPAVPKREQLSQPLRESPMPKHRSSKDSLRTKSGVNSDKPSNNTTRLAPRPLLFGSRGLSFSKASAVVGHSTEAATSSKEKKVNTPSKLHESVTSTSTISERVKSTLKRMPSYASQSSPKPTSPIPIERASDVSPADVPQQAAGSGAASTVKQEDITMTEDFTPRARNRFESMGTVIRQKPPDMTPSSSYSPWLTLVNPCRPTTTFDPAKQYRRWHHLYPRFSDTSAMKWKSLCTPASLPLTTSFFPTVEELREHYEEGIHRVAVDDNDVYDMMTGRAKLLNDLISFRLSKGFQVVQGAIIAGSFQATVDLDIFDEKALSEEGVTIVLSKGDTIHVLNAIASEVQVAKYHRKLVSTGLNTLALSTSGLLTYKPFLKTTFADTYAQHTLHFSLMPEQYNWSMVDQFLAGWDREEYTEGLNAWRARFVFIPVAPPRDSRRQPAAAEDTDDEIRIDGIQRITQIWERHRYHPFAERSGQATQAITPNPLRLDIQTRDASAMAVHGFAGAPFLHNDRPDTGVAVFSQADIDLHKLAHALQSDPSIKLQDRRWYLKVHSRCFVGSDFTTWLLHVVKDLGSRENAVKLGEQLMKDGLFKHVMGRHNFRDGNFFYAISGDYREPRGESRMSWFSKKSDKTVPSTPVSLPSPAPELPKEIPMLDTQSIISTKDDHSEVGTPSTDAHKKPASVTISAMMDCDVDPRRRSKRPEIIKLHYSLLYNPESCYQFRIEWLDANPKLIEDSITHWASTAEKFGLRLVQVPFAEGHKISQTVPFRSPFIINMSVPPPENPIDHLFDHTTGAPIAHHSNMRHGYQRALLKKFKFVLEQEAASNFPSDIRIKYTWGANDYKYNQFIHQSGHLLAQIDDEGRLLFIINRLHDFHPANSKEATGHARFERESSDHTRPGSALRSAISARSTPAASPTIPATVPQGDDSTAVPGTPLSAAPSPTISSTMFDAKVTVLTHTNQDPDSMSPEDLIHHIEAFCKNERALAAFWEEITQLASAHTSVRNSPMTLPRDKTREWAAGTGNGHGSGGGSVRSTPILRAIRERKSRDLVDKDREVEAFEL